MKIQILKKEKFRGEDCLFFVINSALLKTHFKDLMRITLGYKSTEKRGCVLEKNEEELRQIMERAEKISASRCEKSYVKAKENYAIKSKNKISFEDYCEDHLDLHIGLIGTQEKEKAYKSYQEA